MHLDERISTRTLDQALVSGDLEIHQLVGLSASSSAMVDEPRMDYTAVKNGRFADEDLSCSNLIWRVSTCFPR